MTKGKMLEMLSPSGHLAGWYCSTCEWEYRLMAPIRRSELGFYEKASAETLHVKHHCEDYRAVSRPA